MSLVASGARERKRERASEREKERERERRTTHVESPHSTLQSDFVIPHPWILASERARAREREREMEREKDGKR